MRCEEVRRRLQSYVIGEVLKEEKLLIKNHLISCQKCQKEELIMRWLVIALESDAIEEPSADFVRLVMEKLPERIPAPSIKPLFVFLSSVLAGFLGLGFVFRERLLQFAGDFQMGVAKALSNLDPEAFVANFVVPKVTTIYLAALGFACLLVTVTVIWFVRYYWAPVQYRN